MSLKFSSRSQRLIWCRNFGDFLELVAVAVVRVVSTRLSPDSRVHFSATRHVDWTST